MAGEIAAEDGAPRFRLKLPRRVPDFGPRGFFVFRLLWFAAFALALVGPVAGTWLRFAEAGRNSALVAGSRAGVALAERDLTRIRFPVGPAAAAAGIRPGDRIVAIDTLPVSRTVRMPSPSDPAGVGTETDLLLFGDLVGGAEDREVALRLRAPDGRERDVAITTGEIHIEQAARSLGLPGGLLNFVDLLHLLTYPFLLVSAWLLYKRKRHDVVSSIVSLAILLTMGTEQPSWGFLELVAGVPESLHRTLYDLANICLIGGILLFPHGRLAPRITLALLAALPLLLFLKGDIYRAMLIAAGASAVLLFLWRLKTAAGDERQQLKWAVFGFSGYVFFLAFSLTADMLKLGAPTLGQQLALEVAAGFAFGLAFLLLQAGLLVALLRYRLYDAEVAISRSASFALIALILAGIFAATMEGVKEVIQRLFGQNAGSIAPIVGAAISTVMINPVYERVQGWAERRFQRRLAEMRRDLPDCLRDLRHFASLAELVEEVLERIAKGVRSARLALILDQRVAGTRGTSAGEVEAWLARTALDPACSSGVETGDSFFPLRRPLSLDDGTCLGWILLGPHPDRSRLSSAELDALDELAGPVARAVRVVLAREARERALAETLERQQRRIDALARRLAGTSKA
jgi:AcrR family transcriptional regulator